MSAYYFDYFEERQSIPASNIQHAEFFNIGDEAFLAYSISGSRLSPCVNSIIARWNATEFLQEYQRLPTSGAAKMVYFHTAWNHSFLLVVNSKSGCSGIEGMYKMMELFVYCLRARVHFISPTRGYRTFQS